MAKRKADGKPAKQVDGDADMDSGSDDDQSLLNVDFEFFSPAEIDFHGLKSLLRQLLDVDATQVDLSALSDLLISQPGLGTTVKCDGKDSDPFAFVSVLNLREHAATPVVQQLVSYISARAATAPALDEVATLLSGKGPEHVGIVLGERLINMPAEISGPMLGMLAEELADVVAQGEDYGFTHLVVLSKTYAEVASELDDVADDEGARPRKKSKARKGAGDEVFCFHAEDEVLGRFASVKGGFEYENVEKGTSDARRAFQDAGIVPKGHVMVIEADKFGEAVKAVAEYVGGA